MTHRMLGARARALTTIAVLACGVLLAHEVRADDYADEADLEFQLGGERYDAGDFRGALQHFLASNRLVPNRNVVFNIARCYEQLKQAPDAYRYYASALESETDPKLRQRLVDALARIAPNVALLRVTTDPPGASVYLDRRDLGARGATPRTLALAPGAHKVLVELAGYEPAQSESVELKLGATAEVTLKLTRIEGRLVVTGEPAGAQVRLDAETSAPVCTLPCDAKVPPGRHVLFFSADGYRRAQTLAEVVANQTASATAKLEPETGSLVVGADLTNALITIDDKPSGFTPAVLKVPVGQHRLRVSLAGFRTVEKTVAVVSDKETKVDVDLAAYEEVSGASRYVETSEDAPASVTVVSREELRGMGYPTLADAVRGVRGIYLSDDLSYATIGVRGFARPGDYGNRILVTIDGQPMNDNYIWSSYVGYDFRVDLEDVDRIEVIRGPGSVVYGTSAFFGVINVVTRDKSQRTHGEVGVSHAGDRVGRARAAAVVRLSDDAGFWLSGAGAGGLGTDHYFPEYASNPADPNAELDAYGRPTDGFARNVDSFRAATLAGRGWWKSLNVQFSLHSRRKVLPTGEYGTVFNDGRTNFQDTRGMVELKFEPKVSKTVQLLTRAHFNFYNFDDFLAYTTADGGPERDVFRGTWAGLEQRVVLTPGNVVRVTAGAEVIQHFLTTQRGETEAGPVLFDDRGNPGRNDPFTSVGGYAIGDFAFSKRFKVSAGARLDYFSNVDKYDPLRAFSPRVAVIAKPYAAGNLKVMLGKAFRTPSVYELYYQSSQQVRAQGLQPEQVFSGEVELTHHFTPSVSGIVAGFTNYVADLIELSDVGGGQQQYKNSTAPVMVAGGELEVRREWRQGFMLAAQVTAQRVMYLDDPTRREVPNSPYVLGSVKAAVPVIGRTIVAMTRLTLEGPRFDRNVNATDPPQGTTDPAVVWDLVFSGEIERTGLRYNIGLYNLLDWKHDTVPSVEFRQRTIMQQGRTLLASLQLAF